MSPLKIIRAWWRLIPLCCVRCSALRWTSMALGRLVSISLVCCLCSRWLVIVYRLLVPCSLIRRRDLASNVRSVGVYRPSLWPNIFYRWLSSDGWVHLSCLRAFSSPSLRESGLICPDVRHMILLILSSLYRRQRLNRGVPWRRYESSYERRLVRISSCSAPYRCAQSFDCR